MGFRKSGNRMDLKRRSKVDNGAEMLAANSPGQANGSVTFAPQEDLEHAVAQSRDSETCLREIIHIRAAEKRILEMIADGVDLLDVLNELCSTIDAYSPALHHLFA